MHYMATIGYKSRMSAATKIAATGAATSATTGAGPGGGDTVLKGRRGTIYNVGDQEGQVKTLEQMMARRRFSTSRYFLSPAGIIKILVMILFVTGGTMFLTSDSCPEPNTPSWYSWMYPIACLVAFISTAFLYTMFMLGMAEDSPKIWINADLAVTLIEALAVTVVSIFTITACSSSHMSNTVLGPLGLTGAALMAVSAAATYIMWRYREHEPTPPDTPSPEELQKKRQSVFI